MATFWLMGHLVPFYTHMALNIFLDFVVIAGVDDEIFPRLAALRFGAQLIGDWMRGRFQIAFAVDGDCAAAAVDWQTPANEVAVS